MRALFKVCLLPVLALELCLISRTAVRAQAFDSYVFALSWSPGFCAVEGADKAREQCESGRDSRFVVHGLWPQQGNGSAIDCPAGQRPIPRQALDAGRDLFPSEGLARYQWRKHGGCSGLAPSAWLDDVRRARAAIVVPAPFVALQQEWQVEPEEILRQFREANPRLRPGMAAIACPRNIFQEIRICMSRDLRDFVPCPQVVQQSCRARAISVRAPS
jgi:ribonuclease T2